MRRACLPQAEKVTSCKRLTRRTSIPSKITNCSPHFECKLNQIVSIGDGHIAIGEVVYMHFADGICDTNNYINLQQYQPVGRLAGSGYTRVTDLFDLQRPPSEVQLKSD
jgi:flavin reductase (DIM6/NTAB) family NADH-FMN oxidoreductase RutF